MAQVNGIVVWTEGIKAELAKRLQKKPKTQRDKLAVLSSHAQIGQRMAISFGIEGSDSLVNGVGEVFAAGERLVCEMMPLQIAPYSLDGIELRGIFWQPFDAEPGRAGGQRGARRLAGG